MRHCEKLVDAGRRAFLTRSAVGVAAASASVALSAGPAAASGHALARVEYPVARIGSLGKLKVNEPVDIQYPDAESPGVIIKLGRRVDSGIGPDADVVAFSTLCPHKGFPLVYSGDDRTFSCANHFSRFDAEQGGLEIWGHATQNLPQFRLRVQGDDIFAEGVDELIYGRLSNVLGPST